MVINALINSKSYDVSAAMGSWRLPLWALGTLPPYGIGSQHPPCLQALATPHHEALGSPSPLLGNTILPQGCVSMDILATMCVVDV